MQLAEKILASEQRVAVFVPLNEWSSQGDNILASLTHRAVFREFSERDFLLLAVHGRLALVLDGWNELDADSRKRAIFELKRLRRDFPLLQIAISTRRQALDVPISGPTIEIQPLSEDQQLEIAKATSRRKGGDSARSRLASSWAAGAGFHPSILASFAQCFSGWRDADNQGGSSPSVCS